MTEDAQKDGSRSLSDDDIATYTRRSGPVTGAPGTDVDTHSDVDAPVTATDHDAPVATDKDS